MKDLLLGVHVVKVKTLNLQISRCRLADYVKEFYQKGVPHVRHDYFSSFTQLDHCFLALSLPLLSSLLKLPIREPTNRRLSHDGAVRLRDGTSAHTYISTCQSRAKVDDVGEGYL